MHLKSLSVGAGRLAALGFAVCLLVGPRAFAQDGPPAVGSFDLERLRLDPAAVDSLAVGSGRIMPQGQFRLALGLHYQRSR